MCSPMGRVTERCSSTSGSIQRRTSTPTPSYGIHNMSCKITIGILCPTVYPNASFSHIVVPWTSFLVDDIPIRDFKNHEPIGVSFPNNQPMKLYSTLWNGEDWATRGGDVKTDWSEAPFIAYFRNFSADACVWSPDSGVSSCSSNILMPTVASQHAWFSQELDAKSYQKMLRVQKKYMIYHYCTDVRRFLSGIPKECTL